MNLKIILLLTIFVSLKPLEINAWKRIKRQDDSKGHNTRIKQDFVMLHKEKPDSVDDTHKQNNLKAGHSETILISNTNQNISKNLAPVAYITHNISRPLGMALHERERSSNDRQKQNRNVHEEITAAVEMKNLENNAEKSGGLMARHFDINEKSKKTFKHHKTKYWPHIMHSTDLVEAKVLLPALNKQPTYGEGLSSFASMDQLLKLGNAMLLKIGMGSLPYTSHYPEIHMTQNSPDVFEKQDFILPSKEPVFDYIYNSIEGPQKNYFSPETIKVSNGEDGLPTYAISYKSSNAAKEPTQLSTLMQMLVNNDNFDGDQNESRMEFRCPIHDEKKIAKNADDGKDIIQVCSCHFIKKAKEADKRKFNYEYFF